MVSKSTLDGTKRSLLVNHGDPVKTESSQFLVLNTHMRIDSHVESLFHHEWVPACELMLVIRDVTHSWGCGVKIQWSIEKGQDTVRRYSCITPSSRASGTHRTFW